MKKKIETYQFSSAGEELRDFTWGDLADWYLEIAKIEKGKEAILSHVLKTILTLWHPFMPFVTEEVWKTAGFEGQLIVAKWPTAENFQFPISNFQTADFETLRQLITDMRRLRSEQGVEPAAQVEFALVASQQVEKLFGDNMEVFKALARASSICVVKSVEDGWATLVSGSTTIGLNLAGTVDVEKEKAKIEKEIQETETYIKSLTGKLKNKEFISKAPAKVVEEMERKYGGAEAKLGALKVRLKKIKIS